MAPVAQVVKAVARDVEMDADMVVYQVVKMNVD